MTKGAQRIDFSVLSPFVCVITTIRCLWITRAHLSIVTCRANPDNGAAATGAAGAATPRCPLLTRARGGSYPPLPFAYEGTRGQLPHAALCLRGNAGAATPRCPLLTRERGGSRVPFACYHYNILYFLLNLFYHSFYTAQIQKAGTFKSCERDT